MKDFSTFFQICVYIAVVLITFNCLISFVAGLGVFPTDAQSGIVIIDDPASTFEDTTTITDNQGNYGIDALWTIVGGSVLGLGAGMVLGWAFHSTALLAVSIFAGVFWSSYISAFNTISSIGFLSSSNMVAFIAVGSVGMLFIFSGAVAGMLSGSG